MKSSRTVSIEKDFENETMHFLATIKTAEEMVTNAFTVVNTKSTQKLKLHKGSKCCKSARNFEEEQTLLQLHGKWAFCINLQIKKLSQVWTEASYINM